MKTDRIRQESRLKQWVQKLVTQFNYGWKDSGQSGKPHFEIGEDRATLLYFIDIYNKHLVEIDTHPVRKVRTILDEFAQELMDPNRIDHEKILFRLRQFFSSYRVSEYTYVRKTLDDFKSIVWDFVDQLAEDFRMDRAADAEMQASLSQLKEAVESDSIDQVRAKSREFIDFYIEHQSKKDERRTKRISNIKKNLTAVKQQLVEANRNMMVDHLTQAFNRRSFDQRLKEHLQLFELSRIPVSLIILDIDFFKKINDSYGHDVGDFVLKQFTRILQTSFSRDSDFVARIGGEEFAVILPEHAIEHAIIKAEKAMAAIRKEVIVYGEGKTLTFTVSMGIAQVLVGETADQWIKRADSALYESKHTGRDRYTVAKGGQKLDHAA
jgi:diguanylate cyclase